MTVNTEIDSVVFFHFVSLTTFVCVYFFFSSRRRHTRFDCDWSSDVCSSDLSFFRWAAQQSLVPFNPVEGVRGPKAPKPLPKALGVDDAVQLAAFSNAEADPWIEARDAAITELLYSCGLRVGELVGLDVAPGQDTQRQGRGWIDLQAADADRKSTRLNSSHSQISYAVFCLKKKKKQS